MRSRAEDPAGYIESRISSMRSTAFLLCGDWHTAEDVLQTVLVKLCTSWPRISKVEAPDSYVRRMIVRAFLDDRRRAARRHEWPTAELPEREHLDRRSVEDRVVLTAALAAVPPRQRATLVLRFWEDLSVEETAAVLGCTTGTVKSQTARGLETLRRAIADATPLETS